MPAGSGWPGGSGAVLDPATARTAVARTPDDVARLASSSPDLFTLQARCSVCRACPRLVAWREEVAVAKRKAFLGEPYWGRPMPGWGDERAWLLVVGLAPAAHGGNRTGRIFTGDRSGDWIFAALHRAGLADLPTSLHAADGQQLRGARFAAPVRCAPPANKPEPAERDACAPWFDRELTLLRPTLRAVLALGGFAWDAMLASAARLGWSIPSPQPKFGHGAQAGLGIPDGGDDGDDGDTVLMVASYHVSQQNTFTGRLTEPMLDAVLARLALVKPFTSD